MMRKFFLKSWFAILAIFLLVINAYAVDIESTSNERLSQADGLSTDINGANQSFTISLWYKREDDTGQNEYLVSKYGYGSSAQRQYAIQVRGGAGNDLTRCTISEDGTITNNANGAITITTGVWRHFACVYNDTDIRLYINGSLDSSATNPLSYTNGIFNGTNVFLVSGAYNNGVFENTNDSDGITVDVCIWDTALSADEIALIYNSRVKGICTQIQPANLQGYWPLDDCADGASCTADFTSRVSNGSPLTPANTPTGAAEQILTYP